MINRVGWDRWWMPVLVAATLLIVVVPWLLLKRMNNSSEVIAYWATHSWQIQEQSLRMEAALRDLEAAAMMISHGVDRPILHERLHNGRSHVLAALTELTLLTRDNPEQQLRIGRISVTIERRMALADAIAATQEPRQVLALVEEMTLRSPVRALITALQKEEDQLLAQRQQQLQHQRERYAALSWLSLLVQLLLLATVIWLLSKQIRRRLNAEREFKRASGRAAAVLQTVREPIVLLDERRRVILHNPAFAELYGLRGDAAVTHLSLAEIGDGVWSDSMIQQRLSDVLKRGRELWDFEHEQHGRDGHVRTMLLNARRMPLPGADEEVVLMTVSDISLQKVAQHRIQELNRQLEGKVEQVSEVNRELEAFSYSVSHDLRAPLRHVAGFADKLVRHLGDNADDTSRHYLEVISSSARRMASLIDDLLVYSRLGRSALRMQAVDMQSLVAETRAILDANVQSDGIGQRVEWRIAPLPILIADENMMRQVWMNLLGNAVKYSAKRDVARIEVGHEVLADGSHHFSIRDNGTGFDMEYAGKLFGVFQRLHKASEYPGTGIGLASVRRVLARHGGRVWAEGVVDQGATFHIVLPSALDAPTQESTP